MNAMATEDADPPHYADHQSWQQAERTPHRVRDDILKAFYFACDAKELVIAQGLFSILETMAERRRMSSQSVDNEPDPVAEARKRLRRTRPQQGE